MYIEFKELLGKTLTRIENVNDEELVFETSEGKKYRLFHYQDCCESVTIDDICGELSDLVGNPLLVAEESSNHDETPEGVPAPSYPESYTWTFYRFATIKGWVTVRWYGHSNGYYSERVDFEEIE